MKKILIINPFGIGDVLFTTPVISNLRKAYPEAFIGYIVNRRALPIVESNSKINQIYIYERDDFQKDLIRCWMKLFKEIYCQKFDMVFDLSLNSTFGFFCLAAGIKRRIGYDYRNRGRFLTDKVPFQGYEGKHVVEYYLDLLARADVPVTHQSLELLINEESQRWVREWVKAQGIENGRTIIAVVPGGGASWGKEASQKRWPIAQYAVLVDKIIAKSKAAIILMGNSQEQSLSQELARQCSYPVYNAVGATSLSQMSAMFQLCHLAIVNDGGPLHLATAVGVKTVSIFGPVNPVEYGPYPSSGHVIVQKGLACQPCYRQFRKASCDHLSCLNQLSVEEVFKQLERLL